MRRFARATRSFTSRLRKDRELRVALPHKSRVPVATQFEILAGVDVDGTGVRPAGVREIGADRDVIKAVAIDVPRKSDAEAEVVAGRLA